MTAFYEVVPAGLEGGEPGVSPLRYQEEKQPSANAHSGELLNVRLRYALTDCGVLRRAIPLGNAHHIIQFILELHLLTESRHAALEAQQPHRYFPTVTGRTDNIIGITKGVIKKDLIEF